MELIAVDNSYKSRKFPTAFDVSGPAIITESSIDGAVALVIEMKAPGERPKTDRAHRWSKAKPHQREWLAIFEIAGLSAFVCYSAEHALCVLAEHGYPVDTADTGGVR